ncbi:MAG: hypothetical protein WDN25_00105 [Acetobacteraceae bacterium]
MRLTVSGSPVARSGPPSTVPSGCVASCNWRSRLCSRRSSAASRSAASSVTKNARVTPTCIGSKRRPCASTAALYQAMLCATSAGAAYWPSRRLKPRSATLRIERSLPAPIQTGGCGRCAGGGSTTMSLNRQWRPWWEKRASEVHAFSSNSIDSSKRASASAIDMSKPANSL